MMKVNHIVIIFIHQVFQDFIEIVVEKVAFVDIRIGFYEVAE
jgi:hypothetical protein